MFKVERQNVCALAIPMTIAEQVIEYRNQSGMADLEELSTGYEDTGYVVKAKVVRNLKQHITKGKNNLNTKERMYLLEIFNYLPICGIQLKVEHWNLAYFCICADLEQSLNEKEIENLIEFIELAEGNIFPSEEEEKREKMLYSKIYGEGGEVTEKEEQEYKNLLEKYTNNFYQAIF
ncbi:TPA: hypothetical protein ACGW6Z_005305 [Bacillus cereus]